MQTLVEDFQPIDLGLDPKRFINWRDGQFQLLMDAVDCQTRFSGQCAGCGFGKTAIIVSFARVVGGRTLIVTPFTGLQDQLTAEHDFVSDIRGKSWYHCHGLRTNCDMASPRCEARSSIMANSLCSHKAATEDAKNAEIVVTNYSCWFHQMYGAGWGKFDNLILDECDQASETLSEFLAFSLSAKECLGDLRFARAPHWDSSLQQWSDWAKEIMRTLPRMAKDAEDKAKQSDDKEVLEWHFHLRGLLRKIGTLSSLKIEDWVGEPTRDGIKFDPIWPGSFAESHLFRGIPRVLLFSGTLNRKTFELLGVKKDDYTFFDYPSPFHPSRNPLILVPVGDFRYPIDSSLIDKAVQTFDKLVDQRLDRKGILHTISFKHLEQFVDRSRHVRAFLANDIKYIGGARRTSDVVETFKQSNPPAILASPSITAGWDFPHQDCRFQAILKVPFPDTQSLVAKERKKLDPEYHDNQAMTTLCQLASRSCRADSDWNENWCFDTRIAWFLKRKSHLAPKWFLESSGYRRFRSVYEGVLPEPLKG